MYLRTPKSFQITPKEFVRGRSVVIKRNRRFDLSSSSESGCSSFNQALERRQRDKDRIVRQFNVVGTV